MRSPVPSVTFIPCADIGPCRGRFPCTLLMSKVSQAWCGEETEEGRAPRLPVKRSVRQRPFRSDGGRSVESHPALNNFTRDRGSGGRRRLFRGGAMRGYRMNGDDRDLWARSRSRGFRRPHRPETGEAVATRAGDAPADNRNDVIETMSGSAQVLVAIPGSPGIRVW